MIDDPVDQASASVTYPNSAVAQRMTSSAIRERSTAIWASTYAPSAARSRDAVPSMELSTASTNPSSRATAAGSRPSEVPASAPDP